MFSEPETVQAACALAVTMFNGGAQTLGTVLKGLNLSVGQRCIAGFNIINQQRLYAFAKQASEADKLKRSDRDVEQEEPSYESGAFGS